MITLELDDEQADTLRGVIDTLLANDIQNGIRRKHLKAILQKLGVK